MLSVLKLRTSLMPMVIGFVVLAGCAAPGSVWHPSDRFLHDVTVIDVVVGVARPNQSVVIRGDRIFAVRDARQVRVPKAARIIQTGGFVMPGLWDMHVHVLSDPGDALNRVFPLFVVNGVSGVRDMGSLMPGVIETRERIAADPSLSAPDLFVAGPLLDGVKLRWYGDLPRVLEDAASARRELPKLLEQGIDFFKVYEQLGRSAYDEVLAYAARNDIKVAGHTPVSAGLLGAARAGQSTIEHLSVFSLRECVAEPRQWFDKTISAKFSGDYESYYRTVTAFFAAVDQERCDEAYRAMAQAGTYFTPTLVMEFNDRSRLDERALQFLAPRAAEWCEQLLMTTDKADAAARDQAYAAFGAQLERMRTAGIQFLAGSDTPNNCLVPGYSLHWELQQMVQIGLRPVDALRAATSNAAAAIGRQQDLGQVRPGYEADLLVLGADPLQRIEHTRDIRGVMQNGRWYDGAALAVLRNEAASNEPTVPGDGDVAGTVGVCRVDLIDCGRPRTHESW